MLETITIEKLPFNEQECMIRLNSVNNRLVAAKYIAIRQAFLIEISGMEVPAYEVISYFVIEKSK